MAGRAPAPGHGVKLPNRLYAEAVFAAEFRRRTVGQYVEMAVAAQIERDAHEFKLSQFHAADKGSNAKAHVRAATPRFRIAAATRFPVSRYNPPRSVPLPGWVYVLTCPSFPGCCKIGGTGRTARHRAGELVGEYATGQPFTVLYRVPVSDWPAVELAAHRMLSDCRLPRSELFRCTPRQARAVVKAAARELLVWWTPS